MKVLIFGSIFAVALAVSGCQPSPEAIAIQNQQDTAQCMQMGAKPGTDTMVNCRLALMQQRQAADAQRRAGLAAVGIAMMANSQPRPIYTPPRTCNVMPTGYGGGTINCF